MLRARALPRATHLFNSIHFKTQQRNQSLEIIPTTQHFFEERKRGAKFVDKTKMIETIMRQGHGLKLFLSRPRKMGKSLTVEQMKLVALGKREAFGPLKNNEQQFEIYNSEDLFMNKMPVLHLDFSMLAIHDPVVGIVDRFRRSFKENNFQVPEDIEEEFDKRSNVVRMLTLTVEYFAQQSPSGTVIVLIDEYDSPITKAVAEDLKNQENISLAKNNRKLLRSFFSPLKGLGSMIHLLFITGVSKFSYTNLFSSMNDLRDISTNLQLHTLTGYTLEEVKNTYPHAYEKLAQTYGDGLDERIINEYNGFKFSRDASEGLLNPWDLNSILLESKFLGDKR